MKTDPGHEFLDVMEQLCGADAANEFARNCARSSKNFHDCAGCQYPAINMSGFASNYATSDSEETGRPAETDIGDIMACFNTEVQLPVIYQLANEFAVCDAWFSSLPGPTWPNRFFVHGASSSGMDRSPNFKEEIEWETYHGFEYEQGSIFQSLENAGHDWRLYQDKDNAFSDHPSGIEQGGWISQVASLKGISLLDIHSLTRFEHDLHENGGADYREKYPYTFIEPNFGASFLSRQPAQPGSNQPSEPGPRYKGGSSQHPEDDPYGGEALIKFVYESIRQSPIWETSLLVIVYDEHGGFYDNVKPPPAIPPGDLIPKGQEMLNSYCFDFSRYGLRVPAVIVSPLIPKGTVDHTVYDHSSILATLERMLGMKPLTKRDANAEDVWQLLGNNVRPDCLWTLNDPARIPSQACSGDDDEADIDDLPLPNSGNLIGFLHILLKTELELARKIGFKSALEIVSDFKEICTHGHAREYVVKIKKILDDANARSQG